MKVEIQCVSEVSWQFVIASLDSWILSTKYIIVHEPKFDRIEVILASFCLSVSAIVAVDIRKVIIIHYT